MAVQIDRPHHIILIIPYFGTPFHYFAQPNPYLTIQTKQFPVFTRYAKRPRSH